MAHSTLNSTDFSEDADVQLLSVLNPLRAKESLYWSSFLTEVVRNATGINLGLAPTQKYNMIIPVRDVIFPSGNAVPLYHPTAVTLL